MKLKEVLSFSAATTFFRKNYNNFSEEYQLEAHCTAVSRLKSVLNHLENRLGDVQGSTLKSKRRKSCRYLTELVKSCAIDINWEMYAMEDIWMCFKKMLCKLPSALLCSKLYQEWLKVHSHYSQDDKVRHIRGILQQLPMDYGPLAKRIFKILHRICKASGSIDSAAIAVDIGPYLLWPMNEAPKLMDHRPRISVHTTLLTVFIVEHYNEIFPALEQETTDQSPLIQEENYF